MFLKSLRRLRTAIRRCSLLQRLTRWSCLTKLGERIYDCTILMKGTYDSTIMGETVRLRVRSRAEVHRINSLMDEQMFLQRILGSLEVGDVVYDVGANIGLVSILLALKQAKLEITTHAIEPEPRNVNELRTNVSLNNLDDRVLVHQLAFGSGTQRRHLFVTGSVGEGRHSFIPRGAPNERSITVRAESMAAFADLQGCPPSVVKMDVEGAEWEVLQGMEPLLRQRVVREIFIEVHPGLLRQQGIEVKDLQNWLKCAGYDLVWLRQRGQEVHHHYKRSEP